MTSAINHKGKCEFQLEMPDNWIVTALYRDW